MKGSVRGIDGLLRKELNGERKDIHFVAKMICLFEKSRSFLELKKQLLQKERQFSKAKNMF